jgi:hypothetical protein
MSRPEPKFRSCAGFWTPAPREAPLAPAAGVQKAPGHEVAGSLGAGGSQRYGDLIFAPVMVVGAKLGPSDLDRVGRGARRRATGISVVAWSVSTGDRRVDWRGCGERDRRQRGASATDRESGDARWSGS